MNIHPIFVHFPIALLTIYALLEMIRFRKVLAQEYWFYIKAAIVIIGALSSYLTLYTGSLAEDYLHTHGAVLQNNPVSFRLIDIHSNWAVATVVIFSFIAVVYTIEWLNKSAVIQNKMRTFFIWRITLKVCDFILSGPIIIPLALIGLVVLTVTGSLGGAVVFGPNADPIVHAIYNLVV